VLFRVLGIRSGLQAGGQEHVSGVGRHAVAVVDETKLAPVACRESRFLAEFALGGGQHTVIR
jgi:hypothetical protein